MNPEHDPRPVTDVERLAMARQLYGDAVEPAGSTEHEWFFGLGDGRIHVASLRTIDHACLLARELAEAKASVARREELLDRIATQHVVCSGAESFDRWMRRTLDEEYAKEPWERGVSPIPSDQPRVAPPLLDESTAPERPVPHRIVVHDGEHDTKPVPPDDLASARRMDELVYRDDEATPYMEWLEKKMNAPDE